MFKKGFTLIELLIVIGILGILAAGLLVALDPIEQFNRGRDTSTRNATREILGAMQRYYALQGTYPGGYNVVGAVSDDLTGSGAGATAIGVLETSGELKTGFLNSLTAAQRAAMQLSKAAGGVDANISVCFNPVSKGISSEALANKTSAGVVSGTCPSAAVGAACYWCSQ